MLVSEATALKPEFARRTKELLSQVCNITQGHTFSFSERLKIMFAILFSLFFFFLFFFFFFFFGGGGGGEYFKLKKAK